MAGMRPMSQADLPRAAALGAAIGWNQVAADWRVFLDLGAVQVVDDGGAALAATAAILPHGPDLAWISMVLVRPDQRRRGLATALLQWALAALAGRRSIALDATPAGRAVYARLGFRDAWGFTRMSLPPELPGGGASHPIADWPAALAQDARAFGAPREALLRGLAGRGGGRQAPGGFALARDGLRAAQIGPVIGQGACGLIADLRATLPGPAIIDVNDAATGVANWLVDAGARIERPFTRMVLGATLPGEARHIIAPAGPEFG
ncbi:acetyltransferase (GNAT) family protein [Humitalea rosea]|uniref:Acetyltransferase (GNAT) family protein n=2 Tax=Humitalea rosea TaxID=990373 RepID=A0A2W7IKH5_9PROT|nr:acetyltransferase (GNAT) family protein [Humitalea rosea]